MPEHKSTPEIDRYHGRNATT